MPSTPKPPKQVNPNQQLLPQQPGMPPSVPGNSSVPGPLPAVVGNNLNLKSADECKVALEKMKQDIQSHFMNFHAQRQFIQSIQVEAAKKQMPPNMMKDVEIRVQSHYQQMQFHFQKLQQLNVISEEVNQKLKSFDGETAGGLKPHPTTPTPNKRVKHGQEITVPPPAPLYQHVNIQHNVPTNSIESEHHGKRKRKKANSKSSNDPQSPRIPLSPGTPNSVTLKNPFGQFPHAEALKTLYRNHLKARDQNALDNNSSPVSDTNGQGQNGQGQNGQGQNGQSRLPDNVSTITADTATAADAKENVSNSVQSSTTNHQGGVLLTNGGVGVTNGGVLPMDGDHRETEKKELEGDESKCSKQNGSALDYLQKTVNDIEEYSNNPTSSLCNGVETNSFSSASSSKKQKLSEQDDDKETHGDENTIPLKTPRCEISEDQQNGDVVTNGDMESEKVNGDKCDSETESQNQTTDTKELNDISQQNGHVEPTTKKTNDTDDVSDGKTTKTIEASHEKTNEENFENGSTIDESMVNEKERKCEVSTLVEKPTTLELSHPVDHNDQVSMEVDDQAKSVVEPTAVVNPKDLSLAVTTTQQQQQQSQQNNITSHQNISSTEPHQLSNTTTPSDCSSSLSSTPSASTTPRAEMDLCPKVAAPQLNVQGETSYWQLNGKHKRKEVFACRWDRCNS